jgi:hypothetical protein
MRSTTHVIAGAKGASRLVEDDSDRLGLLGRLALASRGRLLAWCVMDTHLHAVLDAAPETARHVAAVALRAHARAFNARQGRRGPLLRGPIEALRLPDAAALGRAIRYVHENPVRTKVPIVSEDFHFEWSSARAFAGLARSPLPDVRRVRRLLGEQAERALPRRVALAGLEASPVPTASPGLIVAAAAQTFGVLVQQVRGSGLEAPLVQARSLAVVLGRLEGYLDRQIAVALGRSRSVTSRLGARPVPEEAVRIARTLLRIPALRARLQGPPLHLPGASEGFEGSQRRRLRFSGAAAGSVIEV